MVLIRPGALPKTTSGKVQRGVARQLWLAQVGSFLSPMLPEWAWRRADLASSETQVGERLLAADPEGAIAGCGRFRRCQRMQRQTEILAYAGTFHAVTVCGIQWREFAN